MQELSGNVMCHEDRRSRQKAREALDRRWGTAGLSVQPQAQGKAPRYHHSRHVSFPCTQVKLRERRNKSMTHSHLKEKISEIKPLTVTLKSHSATHTPHPSLLTPMDVWPLPSSASSKALTVTLGLPHRPCTAHRTILTRATHDTVWCFLHLFFLMLRPLLTQAPHQTDRPLSGPQVLC